MSLQSLMLFVHVAGIVVWVGGMFFAYVCLRPTVVELFDPPQRLRLWRGVLARFFVAVGWAAALIAGSGVTMLGAAPLGWHLMMGSGLAMIAIFVYVVSGPYRTLEQAVDTGNWQDGAKALNRIRQMVALNLVLGFVTIGFATLGRYAG